MLISHKHKFIFIKTKKTAGTSLEAYLGKFCDGPEDVVTRIADTHHAEHGYWPKNWQGRFNLLPELANPVGVKRSSIIKQFLGGYKFYPHIPAASVRNRVGKDIWDNYFKFCVERNPFDKLLSHYYSRKGALDGSYMFNDYLEDGHHPVNRPIYTDSSGEIIVDRVLRYEKLDSELVDIFSLLDIPYDGTLGIHARAGGGLRGGPLLFTPRQRELVGAIFKDEL